MLGAKKELHKNDHELHMARAKHATAYGTVLNPKPYI